MARSFFIPNLIQLHGQPLPLDISPVEWISAGTGATHCHAADEARPASDTVTGVSDAPPDDGCPNSPEEVAPKLANIEIGEI